MRVLYVEDSEELIEKLKKELLKLDVEYSFAKTYEDAVESLRNRKFDFVVVDGNFPLNSKSESDINLPLIVGYIRNNKIETHMVGWVNSTRAQKYCEENNVRCYRKKKPDNEVIDKAKKLGIAPAEYFSPQSLAKFIVGELR